MAITASNDGSDHLQLTNDSYGSGYSFIVEEDTDSGLWTNSMTSPVTVNNGLDLQGTINGEAATGSGQKLTGDDGEENIDGLAIKYTGSTTGAVGNVKLTVGAAERFDRALFNITDPYEGYVAFKQDSLNERIDDFDDQIERMEARLDRKMEMIINKFVAMETALSTIQSQSQWLEAQISTVSSGWGWL
jgi:flagellar hook-associated protein 2